MQRQLRLGDILDDYCPRERRLTNHAVVAMIGDDVKQTRCTTCDAEHEYKHARIPRQRKRETPAALAAQVIAASGPKRVAAERSSPEPDSDVAGASQSGGDVETTQPAGLRDDLDAVDREVAAMQAALGLSGDRHRDAGREADGAESDEAAEASGNVASREPEGPAHRRLIRATLPRLEGQPPAARPAPDFTIRTPTGGRQNRFRARTQHQRGPGGPQPFGGARSGQPGNTRGGTGRPGQNRPPQANQSRRFDGRKRSK